MGGLASRLEPDEQVLVLASNNSIYAWEDGRPQFLARRPRRVKSLTVHEDRLLDSGNYKGVRNTIDGRVIGGGFSEWSNIASVDTRLLGSERTNDPERFGIWDVNRMRLFYPRKGPTEMIAGSRHECVDAGVYGEAKKRQRYVGDPAFDLWDTLRYGPVASGCHHPYTAAAFVKDDVFLLAMQQALLLKHTYGGEKRFPGRLTEIETVEHKVFKEMMGLSDRFNRGYLSRKFGGDHPQTWADFCNFLTRHEDLIPPKALRIRNSGYNFSVRCQFMVEPVPFNEAVERYGNNFLCTTRPNEPIPERNRGDNLHHIFWFVEKELREYNYEHNTIMAMAMRDELTAIVGTRSGKLIALEYQGNNQWEQEDLAEFPNPIAAATTIPREVYEEGLRQKVKRWKRLKAIHAKGGKKQNVVQIAA